MSHKSELSNKYYILLNIKKYALRDEGWLFMKIKNKNLWTFVAH